MSHDFLRDWIERRWFALQTLIRCKVLEMHRVKYGAYGSSPYCIRCKKDVTK